MAKNTMLVIHIQGFCTCEFTHGFNLYILGYLFAYLFLYFIIYSFYFIIHQSYYSNFISYMVYISQSQIPSVNFLPLSLCSEWKKFTKHSRNVQKCKNWKCHIPGNDLCSIYFTLYMSVVNLSRDDKVYWSMRISYLKTLWHYVWRILYTGI